MPFIFGGGGSRKKSTSRLPVPSVFNASYSNTSYPKATVDRDALRRATGRGVQADGGGADNRPNWDYDNGGDNDMVMGMHPSTGVGGGSPTSAPTPTVVGGGGGGSGGGGRSGGGVKGGSVSVDDGTGGWSEFDAGYSLTPSWWKALSPAEWDDSTGQLAMLNLLIPSLSPEDRRQVVSSLYLADPETFAHLNPENIDFSPPASVDRAVREQYQGAFRAEETLQALSRLAEATGKEETEMGKGYSFLKMVSDAMRDTSSPGQQTRQQYVESTGAIEPTLESMRSTPEAKPMASLAGMLARPFFSTGQLMRAQQSQGEFSFGAPNPNLFF